MEVVIYILSQIRNEWVEFSGSTTFAVIKFIIGIYVIILMVNVVLLLFQRGLSGDIRDTVFGMNIPRDLVNKKSKIKVKWDKVRKRLESGNESEYKVAIIEADNILDDLVKGLGYEGESFGERLQNMPDNEIEAKIDLVQAHEVRNKIIHDENFILSKEKAQETMENYENFLRYFMVLE